MFLYFFALALGEFFGAPFLNFCLTFSVSFLSFLRASCWGAQSGYP
jgi:hypothetical protein